MAQPSTSNCVPSPSIDFSKYTSPENGFVPKYPPLTILPGDYFSEWEKVLSRLPQLIRDKKLREEIDNLPEVAFNNSTLKSIEEWRRAYVMLSFLGQGYIWMNGEDNVVNKLPKKLAVPWSIVSKHIGTPPVATYSTAVLYNYGLKDPTACISLDNLYALNTFTGTKDESWFYMVHIMVELAAVPGLNAMAGVFDLMANQDYVAVSRSLNTIQKSLNDMQEAVNKMYEGCDPTTFFVQVRIFQAGSNSDALPDGLVYEGIGSDEPKKYYGASAGESAVIYTFDNFLGTEFFGKAEHEFIVVMKDYMPQEHRDFLIKLKEMPSIRDFCKQSGNRELILSYNKVIDELVSFRNNHIILVTRYIINQKKHGVNPSLDDKGTGGTGFNFLKNVRDDTEALKLKLPAD